MAFIYHICHTIYHSLNPDKHRESDRCDRCDRCFFNISRIKNPPATIKASDGFALY